MIQSLYSHLMSILESQPYLVNSLILLLICAVGVVMLQSHRRLIILSSLLSIPFCFYEFVFIPEYWTPHQGNQLLGLADFVFSFATGGITWILVLFSLKQEVTYSWKPRLFCRRYLGGSISGVIFSLCLWYMGLNIMIAVVLIIIAGLIVLALRFPRLQKLSLYGALSFGIFYFVILKLMFLSSSVFPLHWNHNNLSGLFLWGVPLEEILWALGFGSIWLRFMAYVFDVKLKS